VVARRLRCTGQTVGKWRTRFIKDRLDGLYDELRVGGPRAITDEEVEAVVVKTLETTPDGHTHGSTRKMAEKAGMSHTMIGRIWRTFGLKPHISRSFKISPDPQLVEKVRDVVGLYMNPPANAVVFAVDEKSQIQALQRAQPIADGHRAAGTTDAQLHPERHARSLRGVEHRHRRSHRSLQATARAQDFVAFLRELDEHVDADLEIHVVLDNLSTHKAPPVHRWMLRNPRFHLHFTPTYASWLNLVDARLRRQSSGPARQSGGRAGRRRSRRRR